MSVVRFRPWAPNYLNNQHVTRTTAAGRSFLSRMAPRKTEDFRGLPNGPESSVQHDCGDKDGTTAQQESTGWDARINTRCSIAAALTMLQTLQHERASGLTLPLPARHVPAAVPRF